MKTNDEATQLNLVSFSLIGVHFLLKWSHTQNSFPIATEWQYVWDHNVGI